MKRRSLPFLTCFIVVGLAAIGLAQPVGPQFQVNTHTTDGQQAPSVAADAQGNFVVVWQGKPHDGILDDIFGQRYDSRGNPLGAEFQVNTYTPSVHEEPSVASDAEGNFVVVWESYRQDGSNDGIFGQRFDKAGIPLGGEFRVNTYTTSLQRSPSVAADANGNFIVVWRGPGSGDLAGIFGQRYDRDGKRLGGEFQLNTYENEIQLRPSVASDAQGNFVVVWGSNVPSDYGGNNEGYPFRVSGQRYDRDGHRLGPEFVVSEDGSPAHPAVASDPDGDFVVVWDDKDGGYAVLGQRYDREGQLLEEFLVSTAGPFFPWVSADANGNFVVAWEGLGQENGRVGIEGGIFGQRFDSGGRRLGGEFHVNTYTPGHQSKPAVASDASGNFLIVWNDGGDTLGNEQDGLDGSGLGVFGRAYAAPCEKGPSWQNDPCPGP